MISIVIPCYNEESIIDDFIKELHQNISKISESFEVIFINGEAVEGSYKYWNEDGKRVLVNP